MSKSFARKVFEDTVMSSLPEEARSVIETDDSGSAIRFVLDTPFMFSNHQGRVVAGNILSISQDPEDGIFFYVTVPFFDGRDVVKLCPSIDDNYPGYWLVTPGMSYHGKLTFIT